MAVLALAAAMADSRGIDIRSNLDAMQIVFHGMNVDLALYVLGDGTVIDECEWIFL
jgi:hypothetical protein